MHDPVSRRINAERLVILGWSRAILLQLAHPLVAAGVAAHSSFRAGGASAVIRLHHTIRAMLALVFGDVTGRHAALEGIRAIHRRVHGQLPVAVGIFPAGTRYSAEDPDLVLWVHATLLESIPLVYALLVRPLSRAELDAYCDEAAAIAIDLGARPHEVPRTWEGNVSCMARAYASGAIAVGPQALDLSTLVMAPPYGRVVAPATWMNRLITVGLLPDGVRRQYGFEWSAGQARALGAVAAALRGARRVTPGVVALWPEARHTAIITA